MTPKEKADELFNKMDMIIYTDQDNWKSQCIRCAIIGVDEIIKVLYDTNDTDEEYGYWTDVKQELIQL